MKRRFISMYLLIALLFTSVDATVFATEQSMENETIMETLQEEESEKTADINKTETERTIENERPSEMVTDTVESSEKDTETRMTEESEAWQTESEVYEKSETETKNLDTDTPVSDRETSAESEFESNLETETEMESELIELASGEINESYGHIKWNVDADGKLTVTGTGDFSDPSDHDRVAPWYRISGPIRSAEINVTGMTNASYMFTTDMWQGYLTSVDLSGFDTSKVINMRGMFLGCKRLTNIDLSCFNTKNVTDMAYMFSGCSGLTNLDVRNFETSNVTDMAYMFSGCSGLTNLDVRNFKTSNVTNMFYMFSECSGLTNLDIQNFETSNVTNMRNMFYGCSSLSALDLSGFDTSNVTDMDSMFSGCSGLTELDIRNFDTSNVTNMNDMFSGCSGLTELDIRNFDTSNVTNMAYMFSGCSGISELNLSKFDTGNVSVMCDMFFGCNSLNELDLSNFNTSNVIAMNNMFRKCYTLRSLDISKFDTSNVINMDYMFFDCSKLTSINLSQFDTGNVTDMRYMFYGCSSLSALDLSGFATSNVTNMGFMFYGCSSLSALDLSGFATSNVIDMNSMFYGCGKLTYLNLSGFDTSKISRMDSMFGRCSSLTSLDLSSFDTAGVWNMTHMFSDCNSLECLDLSNFDMSYVSKVGYGLFEDCDNLKTIYTPYNCTMYIDLPGDSNDKWYRSNGSTVTRLPLDLDYSVALGKNYIPEEKPTEVTESTIVELSDGECAVLVYDTITKLPVKDASVCIDNISNPTDSNGVARFQASDKAVRQQITITALGYHETITYQEIRNKKAVRIALTPETGELVITSAISSVGDEKIDLLRDKLVLGYAKDTNDISNLETETLNLKVNSNKDGVTYQLISSVDKISDGEFADIKRSGDKKAEIKQLMENTTGIFPIDVGIETVKVGNVSLANTMITSLILPEETLYIMAVSEDSCIINKLNLTTTHNYLTQEKTKQKSKFSFGEKIKITAPDDMPFFGGSEVNLGFDDDFPFEVEIDEDGKIRIAFNKPADTHMKDFAEKFKWETSYKNADKHATKAMELVGYKSFSAAMIKVEGKVCGYGEGNIKEILNGHSTVKVGVMAEIEGKAGYKHYWVIGFVPVKIFVEGGIKGSVTVEAEAEFEYLKPKSFDLTGGGYHLKIEVEAGAGVGLTEYVYELEVSLTGSANYDNKPARDYQKLWVEASGKVQRSAFYFFEKDLWKSDTYSFTLYQKGQDKEKLAIEPVSDNNVITDHEFKLMNRNYLNYSDGYNELDQTVQLKAISEETSQRVCSVVKSAVLPTAIPAIIESGDEKYLFWVDDIPSRDDYNRTALMYAKTSNDVDWSDPKRLISESDDDTLDAAFDITEDNGKIYIVWQDGTRQITEKDSVNDIFKTLSVKYAVLDTENDSIIKMAELTEDAGSYMYPCTIAAGDEVYFAYVHNLLNTGDIDGNNTQKLCLVMPDGATKEIDLPDNAQIANMDIGILKEKPSLVCEIDLDGNTTTDSDRELFICTFEDKKLIRITDNNMADKTPVIADSGNIYFLQNNEVIKLSDWTESPMTIWEESQFTGQTAFTVVTDTDGKDMILWETADVSASDGSVSIFQTSEDDNGNWSDAVRFAKTTGTIAARISAAGSGDSLQVAYTEGSFLADGTKLKDLCVTARENVVDISVEYVDCDESNEAAGNEVILKASVINNGNTTVNNLKVVVNGESVTTLTGLDLKPYERRVVEITGFHIPEDLYKSTPFEINLTAVNEEKLDDNTAEFVLGCPDVYTETDHRIENGRTLLEINVLNDSSYEASGKVLVHKGYEDGQIIFSMNYDKLDVENGYSYSVDLGDYEESYTKYYIEVISNTEESNIGNNMEFVYIGYGTGVEQKEKAIETYEITSIGLDRQSIESDIGEAVQLSVCDNRGNNLNAKEILWSSGDKRIANVDQTGLVTAYRNGITQITAYYGELSSTCTVSVGEGTDVQYLTIQFDTQGGNQIESMNRILSGSSISLPSNVVRDGYIFTGWYTQPDGGEQVSDGFIITESMILYARWEQENQPEEPPTEEPTEPSTENPSEESTEEPTEPIDEPTEQPTESIEEPTESSTETSTEETSTEEPTDPSTEEPAEPPTDPEDQGDGLWISGISKNGYTYIGEAIKPAISVHDKTNLLTEKADYTITCKNNTKAGTATVIVTGRGNYSGKETASFDILPADIGSQEVHVADFYVKIGKKAQKPVPELYYMGTRLKNNKDFTISYSNTTNIYSQPGEYSAVLSGKGNFTGTRTVRLMAVEKVVKAKPASITKAAFNGFQKTFTYTGKACRQECTVTVNTSKGAKNLVEGVDYTVKYTNNIKAGTAAVTYYGRNGYTGKVKKTYKILPYNILEDPSAKIQHDNSFECVYAKGGSKPKPVITFDGKVLREGTDYTLSYKNNKAVSGSRPPCVVVAGKGCFKGKIPIYFTITAQDLSQMMLVSGDRVYKPKNDIYRITPKLMDLDGRLLSAGKDFDKKSILYVYENDVLLENGISKTAGSTVERTDLIPADTQIRITLGCGTDGNYKGTFSGIYRIVRADFKSAKVTIPKQIFTGKEIVLDKSQITVKCSGVLLKTDEFEIVRYDNNIKKGKASVTLRGTGNYGGMKTVKFEIGTKGLLWWWRK